MASDEPRHLILATSSDTLKRMSLGRLSTPSSVRSPAQKWIVSFVVHNESGVNPVLARGEVHGDGARVATGVVVGLKHRDVVMGLESVRTGEPRNSRADDHDIPTSCLDP